MCSGLESLDGGRSQRVGGTVWVSTLEKIFKPWSLEHCLNSEEFVQGALTYRFFGDFKPQKKVGWGSSHDDGEKGLEVEEPW